MTTHSTEYHHQPAEKVKDGLSRSLVYTEHLMMAILDFTGGPWNNPEPYHSHPHEQIAYVAEGEIIFYCEGRDDAHLKAGDTYAVPSGRKHTIRLLTEKVKIIDTFTPIRQDFLNPI